MTTKNGTRQRVFKKTAGFTLIELLVVIAIIALLAAIIFPVFFTVRENSRATAAMSNMHDISTKLEQYRLDHQAYPKVLFGYAYPGAPMDQALAQATTAGQADKYFPGLYPAYINNVSTFQDPNNSSNLTDTVSPAMTALCYGGGDTRDDKACGDTAADKGTLVIAQRITKADVVLPSAFYKADAFDSSPQITGANKVDTSVFVTRYQTSFTYITTDGIAPTVGFADPKDDYLRQLRWQFPPGNSYVTCSTWHVQQSNKILVLMQDGTAKKVDYNKFAANGPDGPIAIAGGIVTTPFWRVKP